MKRKFKTFAKRIFKAYVVRDIGKFKKYEERLDSVAEDMEVRVQRFNRTSRWRLNNEKNLSDIKINEIIREVLDSQTQRDDVELSVKPDRDDDSLDEENTQTRADIQVLRVNAEGSNSRRKANAALEPINQKTKSEEENMVDQTKSNALKKIMVHPSSIITISFPEVKNGLGAGLGWSY